MLALEPAVQIVHRCLSLLERDSRLQSPVHEHDLLGVATRARVRLSGLVIPVECGSIESQRYVDIQLAIEDFKNPEARGENADYRAGLAFDCNLLTDEVRIGAEAALPKVMAEDNNFVMSLL